MQESDKILAEITNKRNLISKKAKILSKGKIVAFKDITLVKPFLKIPIHGFYTSISWLYVTYYESGQLTIRFLSERAIAHGLDGDSIIEHHQNIVHNLRTIMQHNINRQNRENIAKENNCHRWLKEVLGKEYDDVNHWPATERGWNTLLIRMLKDASRLFDICYQAICLITEDEFSEDIMNVWISRDNMAYLKTDWENILDIVARDLGLKYLRLSDLTNKYLQKWNKQITMLKDGFDFNLEARRIIELSIINDGNLPLPITGDDIINVLNIPPGSKVGETLRKAQEIYLRKPCNKSQLLDLLKDQE